MWTLQPSIGAAVSITYVAASTAFILRLYARRLMAISFIAGDWISVIAFVFVTAFNVLYLIKIKYGLGLHGADIFQHIRHNGVIDYESMTHEFFLLLYPDMWLYTTPMGLEKMAALALYWHIFGVSIIRYSILALAGCVVWWMFARYVVILNVCKPISRLWNTKGPGHCGVNMTKFFYASTIVHLALEICIFALPWYEIRRLQRTRTERIAIAAMFSSGILVCVASLVQLVLATRLDTTSQELWWINTPQAIAAVVEINLAHFSTSLPNMRPILRCFMHGYHTPEEIAGTRDSIRMSRLENSTLLPLTDSVPGRLRATDTAGLIARAEHNAHVT